MLYGLFLRDNLPTEGVRVIYQCAESKTAQYEGLHKGQKIGLEHIF